MKYNLIICGGTFDRLHAGHKAFLHYAFAHGEKVIIGLTSNEYVEQYKKNKSIIPFSQREKELKDFLLQENFLDRCAIVAIDSRFDETQIPDNSSTALLVSEETQHAGEEINRERMENGLQPLHLLIFPLVRSAIGEKISSSKVREGLIDREGRTLFLPDSLRESLHQPFGILFTSDIPKQFLRNPGRLVTVGDVITKRIHELGLEPKIAVIDFAIERKKTHQSLGQLGFLGNEKIVHLVNPPGQLNPKIWKKLLQVATLKENAKNSIVIVDGEEDLFVIPLILMLPLGTIVMYGQPARNQLSPQATAGGPAPIEKDTPQGVVILEITEELKKKTYDILAQFVPK